MVRGLALVVLALSVVLAGCTSAEQQPGEYGEDYKENFMFGCHEQASIPEDPEGGPESPKDYCECVYDGLVDRVPFADAKEFEEQQAEQDAGDIEVPSDIQAVIDDCTREQ